MNCPTPDASARMTEPAAAPARSPRSKGPRKFSPREIDRIFAARDIDEMKWREIGEELGRNGATCYWAYRYYGQKIRAELLRPQTPPRRRVRSAASDAHAPAQRPRYFHHPDNDLRARIASQGITAGFLGDPPPGRSALDQLREAQPSSAGFSTVPSSHGSVPSSSLKGDAEAGCPRYQGFPQA